MVRRFGLSVALVAFALVAPTAAAGGISMLQGCAYVGKPPDNLDETYVEIYQCGPSPLSASASARGVELCVDGDCYVRIIIVVSVGPSVDGLPIPERPMLPPLP